VWPPNSCNHEGPPVVRTFSKAKSAAMATTLSLRMNNEV
jgi:hypothetical protein